MMGVSASFESLPGSPVRERFCILHHANGPSRGAVVHVPAFAEELNKTRRMVSEQARRLAQAGFDVLLPDLMGCGDSPGQFEQATWADWVTDIEAAAAWLRSRGGHGSLPLWLWGTRLGALLANEAAARCQPDGLLLWQPVFDGSQHLQQFLRIVDAQRSTQGDVAPSSADLLRQLASGQSVEVVGYRITAALAQAMQQAKLTPGNFHAPRVLWIEQDNPLAGNRNPTAGASALPAPEGRAIRIERLRAAGMAFWHQVDADDAPAWWSVTTQAMTGGTA